MLCQTWSKYCGLRKVVFPSGDVWIQPIGEPKITSESDRWILVGGNDIALLKSTHFSSEFFNPEQWGYNNNPFEGEFPYLSPRQLQIANLTLRPLRFFLFKA